MSWANGYVGIPEVPLGRDRAGCDCWGLAHLVYAEELGIALPSYTGAYTDPEEGRELDALISAEAGQRPWQRPLTVRPFDLLLFRRGRWRSHIGIAVDTNRMLHMDGGRATIADRRQPRWASRYMGAYRHVQTPLARLP